MIERFRLRIRRALLDPKPLSNTTVGILIGIMVTVAVAGLTAVIIASFMNSLAQGLTVAGIFVFLFAGPYIVHVIGKWIIKPPKEDS